MKYHPISAAGSVPVHATKLQLLPLCALFFSSFLSPDFARQRGTASLPTGQTSTDAQNQIRLGRLKEAAPAHRRTLNEDPNRLAAWQGLARTLLKMNSVSEADEAEQKAQALANDNVETQCIAGDIHFRRSEFNQAAAAYQAALKLDAKVVTAFQLAFANLKMHCNYALALDLGSFSDSIGAEISGFLGYDTLSGFCFVLDYREGLALFM